MNNHGASDAPVLVTGASGFLGSHIAVALLDTGRRVRATVRSPDKGDALRDMMIAARIDPGDRLEFAVADLQDDAGWTAAADGCSHVIHVASPTLTTIPRTAQEMVGPARDGALRVLRAARDAGAERVVLTSAFGAVGYGHAPRSTPFTEDDWTDLGAGVPIYQQSKTLSERAAWDFIHSDGRGMELAVVNPAGVLGPVLGSDVPPSVRSIHGMLAGAIPACPKVWFPYVDVRDVADLHLRAMTDPAAAGERFIAATGAALSMLDIATVLRNALGPTASKVPTRELPDFLVRLAARRNPTLKIIVPQLGKTMAASGAKAERVLSWSPRSLEQSIVDTARSLIERGLVHD
jgi:dihydroflavonol-4-reductase